MLQLVFVFLVLFSLGCTQQNFSAYQNSLNKGTCASTSGMATQVNSQNLKTLSLRAQDYKAVPQFDKNDFSESITSPLSTTASEEVKAGTDLIVVVNRQCALQNPSSLPVLLLYEQINKTARKEVMTEQSLLWKLEKSYLLSDLKKIAEQSPCIVALSPNKKMELTGTTTKAALLPNDTLFSKLRHLTALNYNTVYEKLFLKPSDDTVTVAVIDSGNDRNHPDMVGRHFINLKEKSGKPGIDDDGNGYVDDAEGWDFAHKSAENLTSYQWHHGEHVSGLIAANVNNELGVVGLASNRVKVMHLNVFQMVIFGMGQTDPMIYVEEALRYAADNGAKVINLSLGTEKPNVTLQTAINYAAQKGVFIVAAAGNNHTELSENFKFSPAYYAKDLSGMIAVGATDVAPTYDGKHLCGFSNFSSTFVEIAAPGCDTSAPDHGLLSTDRYNDLTKDNPYLYMEGTSMAAPLVSSAAAIAISYIKEKSGVTPNSALIKQILKSSAVSYSTIDGKIQSNRALDLASMIKYIDTQILKLNCP